MVGCRQDDARIRPQDDRQDDKPKILMKKTKLAEKEAIILVFRMIDKKTRMNHPSFGLSSWLSPMPVYKLLIDRPGGCYMLLYVSLYAALRWLPENIHGAQPPLAARVSQVSRRGQ